MNSPKYWIFIFLGFSIIFSSLGMAKDSLGNITLTPYSATIFFERPGGDAA